MRRALLFLSLILSLPGLCAQEKEQCVPSPEAVVERQLAAYNARDIDAFIATYSQDIEIYNSKGALIMQGHAGLRRLLQGYPGPALPDREQDRNQQ
ncbi:nuclear transport factor 2 family protein [Dysgonomonas sp. GY75]|uniref:nuclear transport factor 2 family protein n=1 Tax=Dysgonomonas sp. GY75 TaxID=2780419 RepID=UPI001883917A|nr:nuclear transport factor 2 family protein [Dysgonomonas sp. GY75]MBF0650811.1 nuclear transport factor 2 family protein [Dysgonomonas sp. GY75]